jgi:cytochrome P450
MTVISATSSDVDLFDATILENPYEAWATLRATAPAVRLERYGVWAVSRYEDVFGALRDHDTYSSAPAPALEPQRPDLELARHTVLGSDPPRHSALRAVLSAELSPRALKGLREQIEEQADRVVRELVSRESFDAVQDLARRFPVEIVATLVGLPTDAREQLLNLADAAFNTFGPMNDLTVGSLARMPEIGAYVGQIMTRETLAPGSWGAAVYAAVDRGEISEPDGIQMLIAFIIAGMDTTVNSIGSVLWLLAQRPEDWQRLRHDGALVRSAYEEGLRFESPVTYFCRETTRPTSIDGVELAQGERVMLLFGSANRDERRYDAADEFRADRNPVDHVAFGGGIHSCAGQGLARIEGPAVLGALVRHAERLELAGEPERHLNNVIRGLGSLPVRVHAATGVAS